MSQIDRRKFLKAAGAAAGAFAVAGHANAEQTAAGSGAATTAAKPSRPPVKFAWPWDPAQYGEIGEINKTADLGPNETVRVGVIGLRGRGIAHLRAFEGLAGVQVAAICDVDEHTLGVRGDEMDDLTGRKLARYTNLQKMYEDKSLDAISIATPNHWHTLAGIWAMQAGKDVYVEKPCSHNVWEGRQLIKAARHYNRMCQHGTQSRSSPGVQEGIQKIREGVLGDVYMARGLCFKGRDTIGKKPDEPTPAGLHYDLWQGPAPKRKFNRNRYLYNWHWNWDYGNGDIGNQGVHEMDLARWALGVDLPIRVESMGGRFMWDDDKVVPNTQIASFFYPDQNKMLVFEVRHWYSPQESDMSVGVLVFGSKGYMALHARGYRLYLGGKKEPAMQKDDAGLGAWPDFIKAMHSRKIEDLSADVVEAHYSSAHCHLANIAYRVGRTIEFDPKSETIKSDKQASALLKRNYREPYVVRDKV